MVKVQPEALMWAFGTCCAFGTVNFLLPYIQEHGLEASKLMPTYWALSGFLGLAAAAWRIRRNVELQSQGLGLIFAEAAVKNIEANQGLEAESISYVPLTEDGIKRTKRGFKSLRSEYLAATFAFMSGFGATIGINFNRAALYTDERDQGPLAAIISTDAILATLIFHFCFGERLTFLQWMCVVIVSAGIMLMCGLTGKSGDLSLEQQDVTSMEFFTALLYGFCACAGFASGNVVMSLAYYHGISAESATFLRCLSIMSVGAVSAVFTYITAEEMSMDPAPAREPLLFHQTWGLAILTAFISSLGVACFSYAFSYDCRGIVLSIMGANNVIVLLLGAFVDGIFPSTTRLIGMCIIVTGVSMLSILSEKA